MYPYDGDQEAVLRAIISDYEDELRRERDQHEQLRLEEAKLRFALEILEEHGEVEEADRVRVQHNEAVHRLRAQERLVAKTERLLGIFRQKLEQLRQRGSAHA